MDILIPSEEHKISMYPMDFEEFLWAIDDEITAETIKLLLKNKKAAGNAMHRNLMRKFRLYMLIGGMPQAIEAYLEHNYLQIVDETKREIVELYEEDFTKTMMDYVMYQEGIYAKEFSDKLIEKVMYSGCVAEDG